MHVGQTQKHPEWRIIVDLFRAADWGEVLAHQTIADATSLRPETMAYYRHMAQARKVLLRDHDIVIETEAKVGYKRTEPGGYGRAGRRDVHLGTRKIRRARKKLAAAPAHLLTGEQMRELERAMVLVRSLEQGLSQAYRTMKNVLAPVQPHRALLAAREDDEHAGQPPH